MTPWALLLLTSALLATPGLTFSGLTPEDHDLPMAGMYEEEQFFEILAKEDPKDDQMISPCKTCKFIIKTLRKVLRHNITQTEFRESPEMVKLWARECRKQSMCAFYSTVKRDLSPEKEAIRRAATVVCRKTLMSKRICDKIVTKYLSAITQGFLHNKSSQEICVKIRMCKPEIDLGASGALLDPRGKPRTFSSRRQLLPS